MGDQLLNKRFALTDLYKKFFKLVSCFGFTWTFKTVFHSTLGHLSERPQVMQERKKKKKKQKTADMAGVPKLFYPISLRMAKTLWSFGRSECNMHKTETKAYSSILDTGGSCHHDFLKGQQLDVDNKNSPGQQGVSHHRRLGCGP